MRKAPLFSHRRLWTPLHYSSVALPLHQVSYVTRLWHILDVVDGNYGCRTRHQGMEARRRFPHFHDPMGFSTDYPCRPHHQGSFPISISIAAPEIVALLSFKNLETPTAT